MKKPYVVVNCASSIDGKIALPGKKPLKISNEEDVARVHKLRNECDAILVGIETILADNPKLTVKAKYVDKVRQPIRIVLDSELRIPEDAEVMKPNAKTIIVTTCKEFKKGHVEVIKCGNDKVDLKRLMEILYDRGIKKLLVEGGSTVIWEFLENKLVDEMMVFYSPIIIGNNAPTIAGGEGAKSEEELIKMEIKSIERIGNGCLVKFIPK
ncbi:2,5-diamino-6-(ribosylamino)-4(3H)-pyrimidinone 5'-phosphate reductase [Thermoplasmatales archaeon ex4484_30]|nr:MAG: 2,5-diamino-6-(ribosylamino)-4(3H)-pyrimidinone 5'-phosphate reductase [Thermoplasmata archaeon]OYT59488.1 MAG: 2,5-diamino-6-(ribosylamino)-4(3H)-pyrimidinone 5'-phosphate reductase [Thermoplasmatales archaeon ex4484_30]